MSFPSKLVTFDDDQTHGFPFFIALTDSQGNSWSQGPLHSGDNLDTSCLDTSHSECVSYSLCSSFSLMGRRSSSGPKSSIVPAAIGAGAGGIVVGLLVGTIGILALRRCCGSRSHKGHREDLMRDTQLSSGSQQSREIPATGGTANMVASNGLEYLVEPFGVPPATPASPPSDSRDPLLNVTSPTSRADAMSTSGSSEPADRRATRNVYVVHHDGGHAPVTVYADEGAEVVELPPRYVAGSSSAPSETASSRDTDGNRRRGSTRKKRETPPRT